MNAISSRIVMLCDQKRWVVVDGGGGGGGGGGGFKREREM